jgi:hypothetical protein
VAFNLVNTVAVDTTDSASQTASNLAGLDYLFGTFIPARLNASANLLTDSNSQKKYTIQLPMRDTLNSDAVEYSYFWIQWNVNTTNLSSVTLYEDATYTTTPGDKGTDTSNAMVMSIDSSSQAWGALSWKFWVSSEDDDVFLVTRGNFIIFAWFNPRLPYVRPRADLSTGPSIDRYEPQLTPLYSGREMKWLNVPNTSNTSGTEVSACIFEPSSYMEPQDFGFYQNWSIYASDSGGIAAEVTCPDVVQTVPSPTRRGASFLTYSLNNAESTMGKFLVNSTDWYACNVTPALNSSGLGFYFGTTEPDLET